MSVSKRIGSESYFAQDAPDIMEKAICVIPIGVKPERIQVFVRPPGTGYCSRKNMYRVWTEKTETLRLIGRMYTDGKFHPLKTEAARQATSSCGWGNALKRMQEIVLAHRVLTE